MVMLIIFSRITFKRLSPVPYYDIRTGLNWFTGSLTSALALVELNAPRHTHTPLARARLLRCLSYTDTFQCVKLALLYTRDMDKYITVWINKYMSDLVRRMLQLYMVLFFLFECICVYSINQKFTLVRGFNMW